MKQHCVYRQKHNIKTLIFHMFRAITIGVCSCSLFAGEIALTLTMTWFFIFIFLLLTLYFYSGKILRWIYCNNDKLDQFYCTNKLMSFDRNEKYLLITVIYIIICLEKHIFLEYFSWVRDNHNTIINQPVVNNKIYVDECYCWARQDNMKISK